VGVGKSTLRVLQAVTREEQRWARPTEKFVSCVWEKAGGDEGDFSASGQQVAHQRL